MNATERKFGMHIVSDVSEDNDTGEYWRVWFENGYGASVIKGPYSYGGDRGLWEVAVLHRTGDVGIGRDWDLCYRTDVTHDVIGYLSESKVADVLDAIACLVRCDTCDHDAGWGVTDDN